jgi:methylmalonyl-CoA decarboxylase subunit alpha
MENKDLLADIKKIDKATEKTKSLINSLVDQDSFVETDVFFSGKSFDDAVEALGEGVVTGYATINGNPIQIFAQNAEVLKGSLSAAHAEKISKCIARAVNTQTPLISIIDSCGARVGDGASIMEGYAKIIAASTELKGYVPHICVVNGVSVGLMTSYVASADFVFMSKDAVMSVNSPMYLVSGVKNFPVDYKEYLGAKAYAEKSDLAQFVYEDNSDLKSQLTKLMNAISDSDENVDDDPNRVDPNLEKADAHEAVKLIADKNSIIEYAKDYASEVSCSIAKINGVSVGFVATKGELTKAGLSKATNFIAKLDDNELPLITLVDTKSVKTCLDCEVAGVAKTTYNLIATIATSSIAKIGVAFGDAIGYGYTALMSKELGFGYTLATTKSKIAPVSEEVSVAMMADQLKGSDVSENVAKLSHKYADMMLNPVKAAKDGYIDNVVEATNLRPYISSALLMLLGL